MTPNTILTIALFFSAICAWQMWAGYRKIQMAKANPNAPMAALYAKSGKIQLILGALFLAGNILLNLPALRVLL